MMISRRSFLRSFASLFAAPAIIRLAPIMPVKSFPAELAYPEIEEIGRLYLQANGIAEELAAVTQRVWIPKLYVELWKQTPLLAKLLEGSK